MSIMIMTHSLWRNIRTKRLQSKALHDRLVLPRDLARRGDRLQLRRRRVVDVEVYRVNERCSTSQSTSRRPKTATYLQTSRPLRPPGVPERS